MAQKNISLHLHNLGVMSADFYSTPLVDIYKVLSVDYRDDGTEYVTAMEGYKYPFFAVMYHPEFQNALYVDKAHTFNITNDTVTLAIA